MCLYCLQKYIYSPNQKPTAPLIYIKEAQKKSTRQIERTLACPRKVTVNSPGDNAGRVFFVPLQQQINRKPSTLPITRKEASIVSGAGIASNRFLINIRKNINANNPGYGKYYPKAVEKETITLRGLAKHMSEHQCVYSRDIIEGVLIKMASCMIELIAQGNPIKIDGLEQQTQNP